MIRNIKILWRSSIRSRRKIIIRKKYLRSIAKKMCGLLSRKVIIRARESYSPIILRRLRRFWYRSRSIADGKLDRMQDRAEGNRKATPLPRKEVRYTGLGAGHASLRDLLLQHALHAHLVQHLHNRVAQLGDPPHQQLPAEALHRVLQVRRGQHHTHAGDADQVHREPAGWVWKGAGDRGWDCVEDEGNHHRYFDERKGKSSIT